MTSTLKSNHWAKRWWNDWNNCNEHPLRTHTGVDERLYDTQTLVEFCTLNSACFFELSLKFLTKFHKINFFENVVDCFCANTRFKRSTVLEGKSVISHFVENLTFNKRLYLDRKS